MKWKREEDCDCCWALEDPKTAMLLSRVSVEDEGMVARVFLTIGTFKTRKSAQTAVEKFLKKVSK